MPRMSTERRVALLPAKEFFRRFRLLDDPYLRAEALKVRFRYDIASFCRYCWPERFDLPFNAFHRDTFRRGDFERWSERKETMRDAVAAPRGYAKTTISGFAKIAHDIVYDLEAFIVLMCVDHQLACGMVSNLLAAFRDPDSRLAVLYGPFGVSGGVEGAQINVRGAPPVALLPRSFGTSVRGVLHPTRGIRPTKVVIDDGEHKDRVRNPVQRSIARTFLSGDVLKLGRRQGGTVYLWRGTVLHPQSILAGLLKDAGWTSRKWQAIISWPERMDLWERCSRIYTDLTLGDHRLASARAFFTANHEDMNQGVQVLDEAAETIFDLFVQIWAEGLASFLREKQNDPTDPSSRIFHPEKFARCWTEVRDGEIVVVTPHPSGDGLRTIPLSEMRLYGRWDPSTGVQDGDPAAIAILGRDSVGYTFVLECWLGLAVPSRQLETVWTMAERWNLRRMTVESNGFQHLVAEPYRRQRAERRAAGEFWKLQIEPEASHDNKEQRIATMEPDCANGWLVFNRAISPEVDQQFEQFPTGDHDDAPDAIHAAWAEAGGTPQVRMGQSPIG